MHCNWHLQHLHKQAAQTSKSCNLCSSEAITVHGSVIVKDTVHAVNENYASIV